MIVRLTIAIALVWLVSGCGVLWTRSPAPISRPICNDPTVCQRAAKAAFDAEMAREGKDCHGTASTVEYDDCEAQALRTTERNFANFFGALEGLVNLAQTQLSPPGHRRSALAATQQAWIEYRKTQCNAIFDYFAPGTIARSAATRCEIDLMRTRMRDLDGLYEGALHH